MAVKSRKEQTHNKDVEKLEKEIQELKLKIQELETQLVEKDNSWKRALADYQNLQKRTLEEKAMFSEFTTSSILRRILPTLDNLEMLNKHMNDESIKMILKEFRQMLGEEGATEIDVEGKDFDVNMMEAVEIIEGEKNKVLETIQKGYLFKNKLLRPARVKVGGGRE